VLRRKVIFLPYIRTKMKSMFVESLLSIYIEYKQLGSLFKTTSRSALLDKSASRDMAHHPPFLSSCENQAYLAYKGGKVSGSHPCFPPYISSTALLSHGLNVLLSFPIFRQCLHFLSLFDMYLYRPWPETGSRSRTLGEGKTRSETKGM
jgi:hypothetical protein